MTEIKFRQIKDGRTHYWGYIEGGGFVAPMATAEWSDVPSDQYTGLKDKNGKEIYEGDILKVHQRSKTIKMPERETGWSDWYSEKVEVYTKPGMWLCRENGEYTGHLVTVRSMAEESEGYIEVIGNVYENPELLS